MARRGSSQGDCGHAGEGRAEGGRVLRSDAEPSSVHHEHGAGGGDRLALIGHGHWYGSTASSNIALAETSTWPSLRSGWVSDHLRQVGERDHKVQRSPETQVSDVPKTSHRCPRQESNLRTRIRNPALYPLSYEGSPTSLPTRNGSSFF